MKYSFVVPIYEDGALARDFCVELDAVFRRHLGSSTIEDEVEVLFVDDGSRDASPGLLRGVCDDFPFARLIVLNRHFGEHIAISCGYRAARGEVVGTANVDQRDPIDQLVVLLEALDKGGFDIVGGLYESAPSSLFSRMLNLLTGYDAPANASWSRVMNRTFVDAYNALSERSRFIPGLEQWLGFRHGRVPIRHAPHKVRHKRADTRDRLRTALESIVSFSDYPLKMAVKFGVFVVGVGVLLLLALIVDRLFFRTFLPGYLSTVTAVVLLGGIQVIVTGIACLYIGRILTEVQGRPLFVVRETCGDFGDTPPQTRSAAG